MTKRRLSPWILLGLLSFAAGASAQTFPDGSGTLSGGERLRIRGCGRDGGAVTLATTLAANGNWTVASGGSTYTGTGNAVTRRLVRLTPDAASLALLDTNLEADATALCGETVTITALSANGAMKVNKRQTRARIFFRAEGAGSSTGGAGNGVYRVRGRGPWTATP
jgi:hypothetical protein